MSDKILNSFDVWIGAQGFRSQLRLKNIDNISFDGINKLRELILDLAVRGKLVPQDLKNGPASITLAKIAIEKKKLLEEGKIKAQTPLPEISNDERPFDIPEQWAFARLGEVTNYGLTEQVEPDSIEENTWVLELEDVEKVTSKLLQRVVASERPPRSSRNKFQKGDVIYGKLRPYLDKVIVTDDHGVCTTEMIPIRIYLDITPQFLRLILKSPYFVSYASNSTHGMNLPRLGTEKARNVVIPIVPLKEQKLIVSKVDELMVLCDELEQQETNHLKSHQLLLETLLGTLTQAKDATEFQTAWATLSQHFDDLFITEDSVDQLKQTILQLAVMGKLVPQDPSDEPASLLLQNIFEKKEQLIIGGRIKRQTPPKEINKKEIPFELPRGWKWCRLAEVSSQITDGEHQTPPRVERGKRLLSAKNVRDGFLDYDNCDFISEADYLKSIKRCNPEVGDLLIVSVGGTIGRVSLVSEDIPFALVRSVALIKPLRIVSSYLKWVMNSPLLQGIIEDKKRGGAQPCLYLGEINEFLFPVPPAKEQERIILKIDMLFELCDSLKERIIDSQKVVNLMAKSVVQKVI